MAGSDTPLNHLRAALAGKQQVLAKVVERNAQIRAQFLDLRAAKNDKLAVLNNRIATLQQLMAAQREARLARAAAAQATLERTLATLERTRASLAAMTAIHEPARRYIAIYRQGLLCDEIARSGLDFSADCYLALLPSSVPAALQLKRAHGGMVVCDCVENVEVDKHSLAPNIHPPALELVNLAAHGALYASDGLMTVGDALAQTLTRFGRPVATIPNYRRFEEPTPAGELRAACNLAPGDVLLFASGNVVVGFEPVLEALARLPAHIHLAAMVRLKPADYEAAMLARVAELGVERRVHFFPFVPYERLGNVAADADVGLITSDITNPNGAVGLPNRLFDYLTAGLPVVVPPMPDVVALVEQHGFGISLPKVSADGWEQALKAMLDNLPAFRAAALTARRAITWESNEESLFNFLGRPGRLTMVGFRDLSQYQRFQRIAASLTARGTKVKAVFLSAAPEPNRIKGAEFYHFEDRYGRGQGLSRVPDATDS